MHGKVKSVNKFSKRVVVSVILLNVLFVAGILIVYWHTRSEPTTLIVSWFAFTTGELWALAGIKREETRNGGGNDDDKQV